MKTIFKYSALLLVMAGCGKLSDKGGTYTISGRLLNNCEEQKPIANTELYFLLNYDTPDEERIGTTDSKGYFSYSFEGPPNNESLIGGSIRMSGDKVVLCGIPNSSFEKNMDAGTIYANTPTEADVTFNINGTGYTDKDTLVLSVSFHTDLRIVSGIRIPGPFNNVNHSRKWKRYASTGNGTMPDPFKVQYPYVRRYNGTFGSSCRWQMINADGSLGKVNYESVFLNECDTTASIRIDLGAKNSN